jgi:hypothetical protein
MKIFIIRRMKLAGHLACLGGKKTPYAFVVEKLERNTVLGSRRCR